MIRAFLVFLVTISLAPPAAADDTLFRASMVAVIAAHGADLASTEFCIGAGRCREMNGWLARFNEPATFGAVKMGVAGASLWFTAKLRDALPDGRKWIATVVNVGMAGTFTAIAVHNTRVAR